MTTILRERERERERDVDLSAFALRHLDIWGLMSGTHVIIIPYGFCSFQIQHPMNDILRDKAM